MIEPDDEPLDDHFRRITEDIIASHITLRDVMRAVIDIPLGAARLARLQWTHPHLPAEHIKAAYSELDQPGRTTSEAAAIIAHRVEEHGNPFHPASDETL